ncbi:hypothetical protein TNCV_4409881 [Trichonephila clavipes]|nr:hypothetical protein TNCV_4409881 [Trichonephila clavipes]
MGEHTPFIEHSINTRNHLPVAVPPYRMNPSKKEILKQEIDRLLSEGIIEECARFKATNQNLPVCLELQSIHRDLKSLLLIYLGHCLKLTQVNNGYSLSRIVPRSGLSYLPFLKPVLVNVQQL